MISTHVGTYQNRQHAAYLLAERLLEFKNSEAVVVAIPNGGVPVGYHIAHQLHLTLVTLGCREIEHPGNPNKTIGSVSANEIVIHKYGQDIPQDYIAHRIKMIQSRVKKGTELCSETQLPSNLKGKTVILVDDILKTGDTMLASLQSIKKQTPARILVAVPVVSPVAIRELHEEAQEIVYLTIEQDLSRLTECYEEFEPVSEAEVCKYLKKARFELHIL